MDRGPALSDFPRSSSVNERKTEVSPARRPIGSYRLRSSRARIFHRRSPSVGASGTPTERNGQEKTRRASSTRGRRTGLTFARTLPDAGRRQRLPRMWTRLPRSDPCTGFRCTTSAARKSASCSPSPVKVGFSGYYGERRGILALDVMFSLPFQLSTPTS